MSKMQEQFLVLWLICTPLAMVAFFLLKRRAIRERGWRAAFSAWGGPATWAIDVVLFVALGSAINVWLFR